MPQPAALDRYSADFRQILESSWDEVEQRLGAIAADPARFRERRRLREVQGEINRLMDLVDRGALRWTQEGLPLAYTAGVDQMANDIGIGSQFTRVHRQALEQMQRGAMRDVLTATRYVRRDAKRLIGEIGRKRIDQALVTGRATAEGIGKEIRKLLKDRGLAAVRYANGAHIGMGQYGQMLARTVTARAYSRGSLIEGDRQGVTMFEVFDGPDCGWSGHRDFDKANGSLRQYSECRDNEISHPNCRRAFGPRPDVHGVGRTFQATGKGKIGSRPALSEGVSTAQERVRSRIAPGARIDLAGMDPKLAQEVADRVGLFADEFPQVARRITGLNNLRPGLLKNEAAATFSLPDGTYAIRFDGATFASEAELDRGMRRTDFLAGTDSHSITDHELGHVLDSAAGDWSETHNALWSSPTAGISGYAKTKSTEAFPEAFVVRQSGGRLPKVIADDIERAVQEALRRG